MENFFEQICFSQIFLILLMQKQGSKRRLWVSVCLRNLKWVFIEVTLTWKRRWQPGRGGHEVAQQTTSSKRCHLKTPPFLLSEKPASSSFHLVVFCISSVFGGSHQRCSGQTEDGAKQTIRREQQWSTKPTCPTNTSVYRADVRVITQSRRSEAEVNCFPGSRPEGSICSALVRAGFWHQAAKKQFSFLGMDT